MSKKTIIILAVAAVIILATLTTVLWAIGIYNGMVNAEEEATTALANVQSSYQRRADLIPNLVETVKGYATHEKETLEGVITARSKATSMTLNADNVQAYQQAQGELSQALGRLIAIGEAYPELKANENFIRLQDELAGTENRIAVARKRYNEIVKRYNMSIRQFPGSLFAGGLGLSTREYFEPPEGHDVVVKAPKVEF